MRDLYLDVNEQGFNAWVNKIIIGNPYNRGCVYYHEGNVKYTGKYSCYEDYKTIPLAKMEVA